MDNIDLIPQIRKAYPVKEESELKQAQEEFVKNWKKSLESKLEDTYYKIYGKSPYLYKFKSK